MTLLYCFDNFFKDPDAVREYALSQEYVSHENSGIFPGSRTNFLHKIATKFQKNGDNVYHYSSNTMPIGERTNEEEPFGEYVNYEINQDMYDEIDKKIKRLRKKQFQHHSLYIIFGKYLYSVI